MKKLTIEHCHKLAESRDGKCLSKIYVNSRIKMLWECSFSHQWWTNCHNISTGKWCPECGGTKKLSIEHCRRLAAEKGGKCISDIYINTGTKYLWQCEKLHLWLAVYDSIKQNHWCPFCAGINSKTIEDCINLAQEQGGKCLSEKYINVQSKYLWECTNKHQWWAILSSIQQGNWCPECAKEQRKTTCLEKYGFEHPLQNKDLFLKATKSSNYRYDLLHWKTGEELVCVGSWEKRVVEYLNNNKIDFNFQVPFSMPSGKRYFVDLYLKDQNLWVEIKGYFRKDAREKWDWFHVEHPNSELWDKKRLEEMRIL